MKTATTKHKQVEVFGTSIDAGLEGLMTGLWHHGARTLNSCVENIPNKDGDIQTWFEVDLNDWTRIVGRALLVNRDLYDFIEEHCDVQLLSFDLSFDDGCLTEDGEWIEGDYLMWSASVRFPRQLLDQATELFATKA